MRKIVCLITVCLTTVFALALVGSASARPPSHVAGSGTGSIPDFAGHTLQADVAAMHAGGWFHVKHLAGGQLVGESWGSVDCVRIVDRTALVTGEIVTGTAPGFGIADLAGHRVALTITDGEPDAFNFDISFLHAPIPPATPMEPEAALEAIPPCAPGVIPITVESGGFVVGSGR